MAPDCSNDGLSAVCLFIDLEQQRAFTAGLNESRIRFLGGRGLGVQLVAEHGSPQLPPLDTRQPFVLAAGPLTGTTAPSSGRFAAVGISPLTGTIFDGNGGGRFGVRLRRAGVDAVVLTGRAAQWSVVVVDGRKAAGVAEVPNMRMVALRSLWPEVDPEDVDLTASRLKAGLRARLGPQFSFLFPGVAGRNGSLLGSIRTDDHHNLGRGGLGAALAAKRVLAVAVAGDVDLNPANPEDFSFITYEARKLMESNPVLMRALPLFGTAVFVKLVNQAGALPVRNFQDSHWDGAEAVSGEALREHMVERRSGCFGCRVRCMGRVGVGLAASSGPEYETVWAFGPDCGIDDLAVIQQANSLCDELGLDTISAGATVACAMEMSEKGILGRAISFGDGARLLDLLGQMGRMEGFGADLAQGSARFAEEWGYPELAMQVKKLEMPAYDPRGMVGQGLGYATSNRGACHLRGNMLGPEILGIPKLVDRYATRGKGGLLIGLQHMAAVFDSVGVCKFAGFGFGEEVMARLLSAVWGTEISIQDVLLAGERVWNLERLWNVAAGFGRADDRLPSRLLNEPVETGPSAGRVVDLEPMLDEYYRARDWDTEGRPSTAKIDALGLTESARRLLHGSPTDDGTASGVTDAETPKRGTSDPTPGSGRKRRRHLRAI
ncbi:MAG: aldehyde ferredoxin oxidoreductase family protein [Actinobacteria bacterium]|nr:aldehyde ferredoxin oxidoreductase family protein [Actinomycetota bacterium]